MTDYRTELTIACTLQSAELADRRAAWEQLADNVLREVRPTAHGVRLVYAASDDVEAQLRELVRLERDCCSFADWRLSRSGADLVLDVTAPGEGAAAVRALFHRSPRRR